MLGNWSFGDYGPKEAIAMAWELLTKVFGLDPARLYCTYFEGYAAANLQPDLDTKELWRSVGVPEDHIVPGNMKDNFWESELIPPSSLATSSPSWLWSLTTPSG
jgi:alanyl-tRNA synthetase